MTMIQFDEPIDKAQFRNQLIDATWSAPSQVHAFTTSRLGGLSCGPFSSLNLGLNSGDDPVTVAQNRSRLSCLLPTEPLWLQQTHGLRLRYAPDLVADGDNSADAIWTDQPQQVLAILTADCLPILLCGQDGSWIAAIHAGWRGLAAGIIANTVRQIGKPMEHTLAWLGPGIGATAYEVGDEVKAAFVEVDQSYDSAFAFNGKAWQADLCAIARQQLESVGITQISGGNDCTFSDDQRFYSYRRNNPTGRMASVIYFTG